MHTKLRITAAACAAAAITALVSCNAPEGPGTNSGSHANAVSRIMVAFRTGTAVTAPHLPAIRDTSETFVVGQDTLVLDSVDLVVRRLKLKTVASDSCGTGHGDDDEDLVARPGGDPTIADDDDDEDGCEGVNVRTGSFIIALPLGGGTARSIPVALPAGTYRKFEFKIHRLGTSPEDSLLLAGRPDLRGASIRATGKFNRTPFTYVTRTEVTQKQSLVPPLVVAPDTSVDLTIQVDLSGWFLTRDKTHLVDPATALAGQPNESLVKRNIKKSFKTPDHDDGDDGDDDGGHGDGGDDDDGGH